MFVHEEEEEEDSTKAWMWHEPPFEPPWTGRLMLQHSASLFVLTLVMERQRQDQCIQTLSVSLPYESVLKVDTIIYSFFFFFIIVAEVILLLI